MSEEVQNIEVQNHSNNTESSKTQDTINQENTPENDSSSGVSTQDFEQHQLEELGIYDDDIQAIYDNYQIKPVVQRTPETLSRPYQLRNKLNLDEMLEVTSKCKYLPEPDMRRLSDYVMDILLEEPTVQSVASPVTICGDIHGQFYDLLQLFKTSGLIPDNSYVFLGDFVDRGYYSLETFTYLLVLKAKYPDRVTLLRGNHETRAITQSYGFYDECLRKYGNPNVWRVCTRVFDLLSVAAVIDNEIMCVHGGLSPEIPTIDQIRTIDRQQEVPHTGGFCDLVWSDPDDVERWQTSPRGAGYLFGERQTEEFLELNGLKLIARAHQLVMDGLKYQFDEKLVTVWSAPNYCYRCGNVAAVLQVDETGTHSSIFTAVPDNQRVVPPKEVTPYFL